MTLAMAWIRHVKRTTELVVAADSRLRWNGHWDGCPKIMLLPRSDAVLCFAGDTMHAYPLMLQVRSMVEMFPKARSRAMDITDLKGHVVRVLNGMRNQQSFQIEEDDAIPDAAFLFGGYSWKFARFRLWTIYFDRHISQFTARPATRWHGSGSKFLHFVGDDTFFSKRYRSRIDLLRVLYRRQGAKNMPEFSVIDAAKSRLTRLLRQRGKLKVGGFDMEPFEVLRDMIRGGRHCSIGGPPQIVKIYRHMNVVPIGVSWDKQVTVLGRSLLNYEKAFCPIIDPDTLVSIDLDVDGDSGSSSAS